MTSAEEMLPTLPPRTTYLVKQLELAIRAGVDVIAGEFGVTALQYTALSALARHPGLSAAQMAHRSFVSPQAGNEMVKILERKGLIIRTPDSSNRHIKRINLTPAGLDVLSRCELQIDQLEARMLDPLGPADIETLRNALSACVRSLGDQGSRSRR
ncbi:MAG: MarR family winged helix-turn-helix transcriptional regulator [Trebonia sp.]